MDVLALCTFQSLVLFQKHIIDGHPHSLCGQLEMRKMIGLLAGLFAFRQPFLGIQHSCSADVRRKIRLCKSKRFI